MLVLCTQVRDPGNEVDQYLVYNIETDLKLILPRRVPPARSAHGAAVYNQKLWVFAGYDGSKRWAFNQVLANQVFW